MLNRVLLDNDSWRVAIGILAGITVTIKHRGISIKATTQERRYLLAMIEQLEKLSVPIVPGNETIEWVLSDFANSVALRGGASWQLFFALKPPAENAKTYVS